MLPILHPKKLNNMNKLRYVITGLLIISSQFLYGQYGKAVLTHQPIYEAENLFFPHDHFEELDMNGLLDTAVSIVKEANYLAITNTSNNGFTGHEVKFTITDAFEITSVKYTEWTDVDDGSEITHSVEKVILSLNDNPFIKASLTGHYTLQIREDFLAGEILEEHGVNDTTTYKVFYGRFKIYSEQEKAKGREWVIDQNEIRMRIKDSLGIYQFPDEHATYKSGKDSLNIHLTQYEIDRSETEIEEMSHVTLYMVIDENGQVDPESMSIPDKMKSNILVERLRQDQKLLSNWNPAIYNGKRVKSDIYLPIRIKN